MWRFAPRLLKVGKTSPLSFPPLAPPGGLRPQWPLRGISVQKFFLGENFFVGVGGVTPLSFPTLQHRLTAFGEIFSKKNIFAKKFPEGRQGVLEGGGEGEGGHPPPTSPYKFSPQKIVLPKNPPKGPLR